MNARPDPQDLSAHIQIKKQIDKFQDTLRQLETNLWQNTPNNQSISYYQQAFRDYETLLTKSGSIDERAHFFITIPVADRPKQLKNCIQSILTLCELYMYGGFSQGCYNKVSVIIADDSENLENITHNKSLCHYFSEAGLNIEYFGLTEQIALVQSLSEVQKKNLEPALGNTASEINESTFSHKGASIMRNITYLYLRKLTRQHKNALIYFIDSDQEFCINIATDDVERNIYAINYFHHINEIFSKTETEVLTGKVVGDPPVSPSVMAGNFLDDVIAFIKKISELDSKARCEFHVTNHSTDDASYHDMADLFGFTATNDTHPYHCSLSGEHSNHDCLLEFSSRLNNFFHGEHPTRSTQFVYSDSLSTLIPARTVYTGNYVFTPEHLDNYIAFAHLHLRMAGPTLGRLLKTKIGSRFTSANLPMLHSRTITTTGQSEFRPNILQSSERVDLSGEFVQQYFGDVMLFCIDELTQSGYPQQSIATEKITATLNTTEKKIHKQYIDKHLYIIERAEQLREILEQSDYLHDADNALKQIHKHLTNFADNIEFNFGEKSTAYQTINNNEIKQQWLNKLHDAISCHNATTDEWKQLLR